MTLQFAQCVTLCCSTDSALGEKEAVLANKTSDPSRSRECPLVALDLWSLALLLFCLCITFVCLHYIFCRFVRHSFSFSLCLFPGNERRYTSSRSFLWRHHLVSPFSLLSIILSVIPQSVTLSPSRRQASCPWSTKASTPRTPASTPSRTAWWSIWWRRWSGSGWTPYTSASTTAALWSECTSAADPALSLLLPPVIVTFSLTKL